MTGGPKKAVVLAAGLGTRLRPLTLACPKPLMPLWNVPLLEHVLRMLEGWGVEEIAVNLHWQPKMIRDALAARQGPARLRFSYEPEVLGTGGALRPLKDFLDGAPFWVVNADIAAALDPAPLLKAFAAGDGLSAAWLEPKKGPRTVESDRRGRITCYRSPTPGVPGTFTFCGLQLVSPRIFEFLPDRPFSTLVDAYSEAMLRNVFVDGVAVPGSYWDDAGTVEAYLRIHGEVKRLAKAGKTGGALYDARADRCGQDAKHFFCVAADATVAADVKGCDSIVCGSARVAAGSALRQAVVAGGCFGGTLENAACVAAAAADDASLPAALAALGWAPEMTSAAFLGARGSNRSFWRLYNGTGSAIFVRYSLERPENGRYSGHAAVLAAAGVPVPAVLADLPEAQCLVLEDWGDDSLQRRMEARPAQAAKWYGAVIGALARLHREGTRRVLDAGTPLEPPFDAALYAWERRLFEEHLLVSRYGFEALPEAVENELSAVAARLCGARQVVVHRDFQSSNILFRDGRFVFIDFQGLRLGAAAYDLASLLYDPYVKIPSGLRTRLVAEYGACHPEHPEAVELFPEGAVQRLVQALGAYGRLASVGQKRFTRHVLPALENLLDAADECGLEALGGLAEELIAREQSRCGG
jgi:hypothetical protein